MYKRNADKKVWFEPKSPKDCLMFEFMFMRNFIILLFSLLAFSGKAQNAGCPTQLSAEQLTWLRQFQQNIDKEGLPSFTGVNYLPVKVHIVGNDEGQGYYSIQSLLRAFCDLNQDFQPSGMQFYLSGPINYIDDNELYAGNSDAIWFRAEDYKEERSVNVFFHGAGMQWCGVYFPGVDVVFVKNSCQGSNATTFTHELGHFFSLPHTFSGWEGGGDPGDWERLDGANCRTAGDGFCDTKADYVSQRWGCPLPWNLRDKTGATFKPDSSIYMSYSSDNCQSRFSAEQMAAMNANAQNRGWGKATADTRSLPAPAKWFPLENDSALNPIGVTLSWKKVPDAFAYHVQIARFGDWNFLNFDALVFDTITITNLFGSWPYAWRVRAITAANTCSSFGAIDTFTTKEVPAGTTELLPDMPFELYPNPVDAGAQWYIKTKSVGSLTITDMQGKRIETHEMRAWEPLPINSFEPGTYLILFETEQKRWVKRLLVK